MAPCGLLATALRRPILFTIDDNATTAGEQEPFPTPSLSSTSSADRTPAARSIASSANNSTQKLSALAGNAGSSANLSAAQAGAGGGSTSQAGVAAPGSSSGNVLGSSGGSSLNLQQTVVQKAACALAASAQPTNAAGW